MTLTTERTFKNLPHMTVFRGPDSQAKLIDKAMEQPFIKRLTGVYNKINPAYGQELSRLMREGLDGATLSGTIAVDPKTNKLHSYIDRNAIKDSANTFREVAMHEKFHTIPVVGKSEVGAHAYGGFHAGRRGTPFRTRILNSMSSSLHGLRTRPGRVPLELAGGAALLGGAYMAGKGLYNKFSTPDEKSAMTTTALSAILLRREQSAEGADMITAHELGYRVGSKQAGILSGIARGVVGGGALGTGLGAVHGVLTTPADSKDKFNHILSSARAGLATGALLGGAHGGYKGHRINKAKKLLGVPLKPGEGLASITDGPVSHSDALKAISK